MLLKKNSFRFFLVSGAIVLLTLAILMNVELMEWGKLKSSPNFSYNKQVVNLEPNRQPLFGPSKHSNQIDDVEINKRIQLLESSLKELHSQLANKSTSKTDTQLSGQSDEENTDLAEIEREKTNKLVNYLDQQMHMEKIDPKWSEDTKAKITSEFADTVFINKIDCVTTLCKVSVDHDNQDAERAFIRKLTSLKPFINTDAFIERKEHEDGSVSTQIFIARSNHRLPAPLAVP